ncbi:MAG TPA: energy transducer TonB [Holophagaceae bacterium]|nr:energy transducer TonB [Holophagaceae bacterium]
MRNLAMLLVVSNLWAQAPKAVFLKTRTFPEEMYYASRVDPLTQDAVNTSLKPLVESMGFRVVDEATAERTPEALVLEASGASFRSPEGDSGLQLQVQLATAGALLKGAPDPGAAHGAVMIALPGKVPTGSWLAENLAKLARNLVKRREAWAANPPGKGKVDGATSTPVPPPPSRVEPAAPAPPAEVADFDFKDVQVRSRPRLPAYPILARANAIQGKVVAEVIINDEGQPTLVSILEGPLALQSVAAFYALRWRFEPARLNGKPQWARFRIIMPFKLR